MTAPARRGRPARYAFDDLLGVVTEEFLVRGYDATSMEDLARATGLAKSALYHHVSGKEELLQRALSKALDGLFAVLDEPPARSGPAVGSLEHVVRRATEVLVAELPSVTLLLRVRGNTETERWALQRRRDFDKRLARLVQRAMDEGDLRDDLDPHLVARLLFGMVNSVVEWYQPPAERASLRASGASTRDRHETQVPDALVALAFDGLRRAG